MGGVLEEGGGVLEEGGTLGEGLVGEGEEPGLTSLNTHVWMVSSKSSSFSVPGLTCTWSESDS